ncbi:MAG: hypothetical protein WKF34_04175 [Pyrinomonadaceae bacterium]
MGSNTEYQTIVIEWYGPVSWETIEDLDAGGLYLFTGRQKYQRKDAVQYIGITEGRYRTRFSRHHKAEFIVHNLRCWVGQVKHPSDLGRVGLERAESMLVYFACPDLNERKTVRPPRPTAVISHWFNEHSTPRYNRQGIFKDFPDVISWDGEHWREGNLRVWDEV